MFLYSVGVVTTMMRFLSSSEDILRGVEAAGEAGLPAAEGVAGVAGVAGLPVAGGAAGAGVEGVAGGAGMME